MKSKYQNAFFIFGIVVLAIMVSQLDFAQVWEGLKNAGYWFFAVLALWAFLYCFNTTAWWLLIKGVCSEPDGKPAARRQRVNWLWLYKVTVSGFALNYATPGGLMGGEPYRVMALAPTIGTERATSSVILYAMTHIFSHFWFWLICALLFLLTQRVSPVLAVLLCATLAFCVLGIAFFVSCYRHGLANRAMRLMRRLPLVKRWANPFMEKHGAQVDNIDRQISTLHQQSPRFFVVAVLLELACRFASALEVYFILLVITPGVSYLPCVLILAFTSLFANLLFFLPLQLGGREGGFLLSATSLGLTASAGIFVALIVRLRELVWVGIGLLLIKVEKRRSPRQRHSRGYT